MSDSTVSALDMMSSSDLRSLKTAINESIDRYANMKEIKNKSVKALDIYIAPLTARKNKMVELVDNSLKQVKLIPSEAIVDSPELGVLATSIDQSMSIQSQSAMDTIELINNLNVEKAQLAADIDSIDSTTEFLNSMLSDIDTVLSTRSD